MKSGPRQLKPRNCCSLTRICLKIIEICRDAPRRPAPRRAKENDESDPRRAAPRQDPRRAAPNFSLKGLFEKTLKGFKDL